MFNAKSYGPWALIAGASEGVGVSFAYQLAAAGINLVLVSRQGALLEQTATQIRAEHSVQTRILALDLSGHDVLDRVRDATDDIDVGLVIFNAGASSGIGAFLDVSIEAIHKGLQIGPQNYSSFVYHFGNKMVGRGCGGIIFMGALTGNAGAATTVLYGAIKAFAQNFAEGLWSELKPRGVDVLYVVLGATRTPARARLGLADIADEFVAEPDDVARESLENLANGPVLVPENLAEAFQHFSSMPRRLAAETMSNFLLGFFKK